MTSQERKRRRDASDAPSPSATPATRLQTGRFGHLRQLLQEQELVREQRRLLERRLELLRRLRQLKEQRTEATD